MLDAGSTCSLWWTDTPTIRCAACSQEGCYRIAREIWSRNAMKNTPSRSLSSRVRRRAQAGICTPYSQLPSMPTVPEATNPLESSVELKSCGMMRGALSLKDITLRAMSPNWTQGSWPEPHSTFLHVTEAAQHLRSSRGSCWTGQSIQLLPNPLLFGRDTETQNFTGFSIIEIHLWIIHTGLGCLTLARAT